MGGIAPPNLFEHKFRIGPTSFSPDQIFITSYPIFFFIYLTNIHNHVRPTKTSNVTPG